MKCGLDPHHQRPDGPGALNRTDDVQNKINNIAKGFFCTDWRELEGRHDVFGGDTYAEQRAGFLVKFDGHWDDPHVNIRLSEPGYREPDSTVRLVPRTRAIWQKWAVMEGPNTPLERSVAGRRDDDINIDGFAHDGMLPDLWQDLKNCLVSAATDALARSASRAAVPSAVPPTADSGDDHPDMHPLFQSAEDFIELWERCQAFADRGGAGPAASAGPSHGGPRPAGGNHRQYRRPGATGLAGRVLALAH